MIIAVVPYSRRLERLSPPVIEISLTRRKALQGWKVTGRDLGRGELFGPPQNPFSFQIKL